MSRGSTRTLGVLLGLFVVGLIFVGWLTTFVKAPQPAAQATPKAPLRSVGIVDAEVIQGTSLFDPTPLFLPSAFSSARKDYIPKEPDGTFAGFPYKQVFGESSLALSLPAVAETPKDPADSLTDDPPGSPLLGFGRSNPASTVLAARSAFVEIMEAGSGKRVMAESLMDAHPPASVAWQPMEFLAAVDAAGLVGPVVATSGSGVADVDDYFSRYIADTLHIGERVSPGFYRIVVGP